MDENDYVDQARLDTLPEEVRATLEYLALTVSAGSLIRVRVTARGFVLWDCPGGEPPMAALVDPDGNLRDLPWALEEGLPDKAPIVFYYEQVKERLEMEAARRARDN